MRNVEPDKELRTPFQAILDALRVDDKDLPRPLLQRFSDVDPASLEAFLKTWSDLTLKRKKLFLASLLALLDSDTLVSFDALGRALLRDPDAVVRAGALRLLSESDDPKLIPIFIDILHKDPEIQPRTAAAILLGEFVMLGELEELPEGQLRLTEEALLSAATGSESAELQRGAIEALGYSSRNEVGALIASAFHRQDPDWIKSALVAMGRSSDERWEDDVLGMLLNENTRIRRAAVEAAGQLSLDEAGPILIRLLEDEDDEQVIAAAVWSLSEIGGEDARVYMQSMLDQTTDPEQIDFIEDALDNLTFTDELNQFDLMAYDPEADDAEEKEN
jgi:HEAT repeat protein